VEFSQASDKEAADGRVCWA